MSMHLKSYQINQIFELNQKSDIIIVLNNGKRIKEQQKILKQKVQSYFIIKSQFASIIK
ncbi:unnamed protein product [Paramecium pentaurelia]|uniref:Uncharacterized protein n=1 Tax=Paramecium pentaurelia TaxID=43138 RepID=A0A8S1SRF7_9CILI|nr:unnamed protein product [Paramecium pentaurelia]